MGWDLLKGPHKWKVAKVVLCVKIFRRQETPFLSPLIPLGVLSPPVLLGIIFCHMLVLPEKLYLELTPLQSMRKSHSLLGPLPFYVFKLSSFFF